MLRIAISLGNSSPVTVAEAKTFLISAINCRRDFRKDLENRLFHHLGLRLLVEQVGGVGLELGVDQPQGALSHNLLTIVHLGWRSVEAIKVNTKFLMEENLAENANYGCLGVSSDQGHE